MKVKKKLHDNSFSDDIKMDWFLNRKFKNEAKIKHNLDILEGCINEIRGLSFDKEDPLMVLVGYTLAQAMTCIYKEVYEDLLSIMQSEELDRTEVETQFLKFFNTLSNLYKDLH